MAKMIPAALSPAVKSPAERKIFEWFKNDPMTKDWVVFHSLGIENHQTVIFGEIDFLVAASDQGVFALEVKGGRIRREDGVWVYTDKYGIGNRFYSDRINIPYFLIKFHNATTDEIS